jgi:protein-tyrosine phosphatase
MRELNSLIFSTDIMPQLLLLHKVFQENFNLPLTIIANKENVQEVELFRSFSKSGEIYLHLLKNEDYGKRLVGAMKLIADPAKHPLVFHCYAGKDRSGIVAALILSILVVEDRDIIDDHVLSAPYTQKFIDRWNADPRTADVHSSLPEYQLRVFPDSMAVFLTGIKKEYGSAADYLRAVGAERTLFDCMKSSLLF